MRTTFVSKVLGNTSFYLLIIPTTGAAALTYRHTLNPDRNSPFHYITTSLNGVVRSSRSLYTIAANVVDYKYSLHGSSSDTDQYTRILSEVHLRSAKRILKLCEINQGFYIKAGQFVASMRQVPKEYSSILASLQDHALPTSFEYIKDVLISNLGTDLKEIFLSIDEKPIAAASIAQVHRALLKDHQEVVLKVQYPGLKDRMKIDIATMSLLAKCVTRFFPEYRFQWMVSEFSEMIALELDAYFAADVEKLVPLPSQQDFIQEARNSERTAINFKHNSRIRVPKVFPELTTSQVLTMEYCRGRRLPSSIMLQIHSVATDLQAKIDSREENFEYILTIQVDDLEFIEEIGVDPKKVAKVLTEAFAEMIFVHGFVHGDPHPGNILVSPDEKQGFCLVLLDHGIYTTLNEEFRINYCQLWKALILLDSNKIQQIGQQFGIRKHAKYLPLIFTGRTINSKAALGSGMSAEERTNLKQEVKSLSIGDISDFMESLDSDFLTVLRTDALLRSLTTKLGSSHRVRLLVYANYALDGLSLKPDPDSDLTSKAVFTRIMSRISHLQFRVIAMVVLGGGYETSARYMVEANDLVNKSTVTLSMTPGSS